MDVEILNYGIGRYTIYTVMFDGDELPMTMLEYEIGEILSDKLERRNKDAKQF